MIPKFSQSGRKTDRWLAYMLLVLHCFMAVFIVYTSYQQGEAEKAREETVIARERADTQRAELNEKVEMQNRLLLCFATDTQAFNLAIADALLVAPPRPDAADEYRRLAEIRDRLRASERLTQANPPSCNY